MSISCCISLELIYFCNLDLKLRIKNLDLFINININVKINQIYKL